VTAPGIAFARVLEDAPAQYVRDLLGKDTCHLLDLVNAGAADDAMLRRVAVHAVSPERLIADPGSRDAFLTLLPAHKRTELAERLGWDGQRGDQEFLRACDWNAEHRLTLLGFLGHVVERAPLLSPAHRRVAKPSYGLFRHQRSTAGRVRSLLYRGERRAVLHLPTGVGKTRTAMDIICEHLRGTEPTLVVWLARGNELLEQATAEFERAWAALGNREVRAARMWGDSPTELDGLSDGLVVLGLDKAAAAARKDATFLDRLGLATTLTVFDEAHQAIAPTYQRVAEALSLRRDASLLGLTATPGRTWADISEDERLAQFFARQKVMLEIDGHDNPVTALVDDGYLARPTFRTVAVESGIRLRAEDQQALADAFDVPERLLHNLTVNAQWNLQVLRTVLDLVEHHRRVLLFASSVDHSRVLVAALSALGVDAEQVTAESSSRHRERVIGRFKSNAARPMVLSNYGVLTTGFDAPAASAAVIARPTRSLVLYSQMVGRVIRGPRAGGTPTCEVVTVVDPELPGFGDVAEAFTNWEDVWSNK